MTANERLTGCLLGTAVGDALGLCREGLSKARAERMYPRLEGYQLFGGRGLCSDDTEHAVLTAWALSTSNNVEEFQVQVRRGIRRWFLSLPPGIGWATLRAGVKLSLGLRRTGVYSAGNGPVMRAPVLGAWAASHGIDLAAYVRASTEVTHTDPRAFDGALLVAEVTRRLSLDQSFDGLELPDVRPEESTEDFATRHGWATGVSGFVCHTVPVVVQAALRHRDDLEGAIRAVIGCGGDSDTTAAIVGGMLGARLGKAAIPTRWLRDFGDWPTSLRALESFAERPRLPNYPASLVRNLGVGWAILGYGFRRLLPPY
jgi:ADP-ribosyl-[dinitrogen reductase] hydrolase